MDLATVRGNNRLDDGEAKSRTPGGAGPSGVTAIETLEDMGQVLGWNADSSVGHANDSRLVFAIDRNGHCARGWRVPPGILQEVAHRPPEGPWINGGYDALAAPPLHHGA